MGVLPLQFLEGESAAQLDLDGSETFDIDDLDDQLTPLATVNVRATRPDGAIKSFQARVRIDTPVEVDYYRNGGILQTVLRRLAAQ